MVVGVVVVVEAERGSFSRVEHILCRTSDIVVKKSGLNYFIMVFCIFYVDILSNRLSPSGTLRCKKFFEIWR